MVKPVVRPILAASARGDFLAFPPFFARLLAFLKTAAENDCTLPKQARYQLRYIPKLFDFVILLQQKYYTTNPRKCQVKHMPKKVAVEVKSLKIFDGDMRYDSQLRIQIGLPMAAGEPSDTRMTSAR